GGLARFTLGSIADRLVRHADAPILLVRAFGAPTALERVVVPLDGSRDAEAALRVVKSLPANAVQDLTLLRVITAPEDGPEAERYLAEVGKQLQQDQLVVTNRVELGDPSRAIVELAGRDRMVVMATHGHGAIARWALGSVADRVARHAEAAVLLVRSSAEPNTP